MRILTVFAEEFGLYENRRFCFDAPLTLIEGENESGKTTLQTLILFLLYGFPRHGDAALADRARGLSRKGRRAAAEMTFLWQGREWRLCRTYLLRTVGGKESAYEECRVTDDTGASQSLDGRTPGEYFLGIPRALYEACACVRQSEIAQVTATGTGDAVSELLFLDAGGARLDKATRALDAARRELQHTRGDGGRIAALTEERATLEMSLKKALLLADELHALREEQAALAASLAEKEREQAALLDAARVGELEEILERFADFHEAECEKDRLARLIDTYEQASPQDTPCVSEALLLALRERAGEEATLVAACEASAARRHEAESALARHTGGAQYEKIEQLGGADVLATRAVRLGRGARNATLAGVLLLLLALALAGLALPLVAWRMPLCILGGALFVLSLIGFALGLRARGKLRALLQSLALATPAMLRTVLAAHRADVAAAAAAQTARDVSAVEYTAKSAALAALREDCNTLLAGAGILSQPTAMQALTAALDARASQKGLFEERLTETRMGLASARARAEALSHALAGLDEEALCRERAAYPPEVAPISAEAAGPRLAALQSAQSALRARALALAKKEAELAAGACDPSTISAALQENGCALTEAKDRLAAIRMASEALLEADRALRGSVLPRVTSEASRILAALTGGKYGTLTLTDKFAVSLQTDTGTFSLHGFSAGCRDAVGLALRMALVRLIAKEPIPLLFDEVTARLDDTRTKRLLAQLLQLAGEGEQILLFTCHTREARMLGERASRVRL